MAPKSKIPTKSVKIRKPKHDVPITPPVCAIASSDVPDAFFDKKWLINDHEKVIADCLSGLVKCNPHLALLEIGHVIVRRDHLKLDQVKIISGGASGHEPAFAGFVGLGMLTASVQGGIYSSPTPSLVLATIKELARRNDKGVLVIIGDNMSDRLSFGLAVERAKNIPNVKIRILQVSDDCNNTFDRRGITGSLLIQKIAGAMAENNIYLHEIYVYCQSLIKSVATVIISLKPAVSPHYTVSSCARIQTSDIEFGSGMHGESGYLRIPMTSCQETVRRVLEHITSPAMIGSIELNPTIPVVVLVNNLGHSSKLEELILVNELVTQLKEMHITIERVYCGSFLTSFEMCGFSVTIFNLIHNDILMYLDTPTLAPFWKCFSQLIIDPDTSVSLTVSMSPKEVQLKPNRGPVVSEISAIIIENVINFSCGALISCEQQLNFIDSESGDSDTGTNIKNGAQKINECINKGKLHCRWPFVLFQEISEILDSKSEGLMSCFYSIMFEAGAQPLLRLAENDFISQEVWCECLELATKALARYGRVTDGQLTMYDSLNAASIAFKNAIKSEIGILDTVGLVAVAAEDTSRKTRRDGCLHPDPGAHAVGIWMRAVFETLKLHAKSIQ